MKAAHAAHPRVVDTEIDEATVENVKEFLWKRLHKMDPDAALTNDWDGFFRVHHVTLRCLAAKFVPWNDREDMVQEVWLQVLTHLPRLTWPAQGPRLRGGLCKLIRHKEITLFRRRACRPDRMAGSLAGCDPIDQGPLPDADLQHCFEGEFLKAVLASLNKQPSECNRRLLEMRWVEGRSVAEVSRALGLTAREVSHRQKRVLRKLRTALAWYWGDRLPENPAEFVAGRRRGVEAELIS
jgi:RNA polymerase sigma factor (sigma-70 family)